MAAILIAVPAATGVVTVASFAVFGPAERLADVAGGVAGGVAVGVAVGVAFGVAVGVAFGAAVGVAVGVAGGVAGGVAFGAAVGVAVGVAFGVAFILSFLRVPISCVEALVEPAVYFLQTATGRASLQWAPVLWHDLSYLPHPFLRRHILDTAEAQPELARRVIERCADVPGQRRIGRSALAALQARELEARARRHEFAALAELHGRWLPGVTGADPLLLPFRDVAAYLRAAQDAMLPYHRLGHLRRAEGELSALRNRLAGEESELAGLLRPVAESWGTIVAAMRAEAAAAAAHVIPNPFRAGDPLTPEEGREVFRGREEVIRRIETLLADPGVRGSIVLLAPRRCGKTSLLNMLPVMLPDTLCVLFDIQDNPIETPESFARALVDRTAAAAQRKRLQPSPSLPEGGPLEALGRWLRALDEGAGDGRVLIAFDEFERLETLWPGDRREFLRLLGLLRATIQHRRRVRLLVAGAAPFDELGSVWNDHFISAREVKFGHLAPDVARELLTKPIPEFPEQAIPQPVVEAVVERTGCQPFLLQLYGSLLVKRLNDSQRARAEIADVAAVEEEVISQGDSAYYLRNTFLDAPEPMRDALQALATEGSAEMDARTRRWLAHRCLLAPDGRLAIPVLGRWIREEIGEQL